MSVQAPAFRRFCHFTTDPVYPLKVKVPVELPSQIVVEPEMLPPTLVGSTMIVASDDVVEEQVPLCTIAW